MTMGEAPVLAGKKIELPEIRPLSNMIHISGDRAAGSQPPDGNQPGQQPVIPIAADRQAGDRHF
ncbi:hypothetical protein J43TS9_09010 [Paenibacillus cineris]|nr:hypothetical protein J43TS9_09010 [Paenibacillus cineris]